MSIGEILDELVRQAQQREARKPPSRRPYVLLNMASTADGRASVDGRAGPIGDRADSELLHGLRTVVDGLLVGAGTVRAERYARLLRGPEDRSLRREHRLPEELSAYIVSASLHLDQESVPLLGEPQAPVTLVTSSPAELAGCAASVRYLRCERDGVVDLEAALQRMRGEHGVRTLLCEGGPQLAAQLVSAGLVDELFLSIAPKLAGGEAHLRILAGAELQPPHQLELISLHEHRSSLFMRYRLGA